MPCGLLVKIAELGSAKSQARPWLCCSADVATGVADVAPAVDEVFTTVLVVVILDARRGRGRQVHRRSGDEHRRTGDDHHRRTAMAVVPTRVIAVVPARIPAAIVPARVVATVVPAGVPAAMTVTKVDVLHRRPVGGDDEVEVLRLSGAGKAEACRDQRQREADLLHI